MNELIRNVITTSFRCRQEYSFPLLQNLAVTFAPYQKAYSQIKLARYTMLREEENTYKARCEELSKDIQDKEDQIRVMDVNIQEHLSTIERLREEIQELKPSNQKDIELTLLTFEQKISTKDAEIQHWQELLRESKEGEAALQGEIEKLKDEVEKSLHPKFSLIKIQKMKLKEKNALLTQELSDKLGIIDNQERVFNERSVLIEQLNQELSTKQRIIEELEKELNEKGAGTAHFNQDLSTKLGIMECRERELNERGTWIEQVIQELSDKLGIVENQEKELNERSAEIAHLNQDLSIKLGIVEYRERELNERSARVEQMNQDLSAKLGIVEYRERELNEKSKGIAHLNQDLSAKLGIIECREREHNERSAWIEQLIQDDLSTKLGIIENQKKEINVKNAQIEQLNQVLFAKLEIIKKRKSCSM